MLLFPNTTIAWLEFWDAWARLFLPPTEPTR